MAGASDIVGIDIQDSKFDLAKTFGADYFVNPTKFEDGGRGDLMSRGASINYVDGILLIFLSPLLIKIGILQPIPSPRIYITR